MLEKEIQEKNPTRWRVRLFDARFILISTFFVLLSFVLLSYLSIIAALIGFFIIAFTSLFIPRRVDPLLFNNDDREMFANLRQKIAFRFANSLSNPTIILDEKANIIHLNSKAQETFISAKIDDPIAFSFRNPILLSAIEEVKKTNEPKSIEIHQSGLNEKWFNVAISLFKLQRKEPLYMVLSLQDLSEQKKSDAMRSDFIANASHELRTPLTSLIGFIDTIEGAAANDKEAREKFLKIMRSQAGRMSKLIDDLLSLSKIELSQNVKPTNRVDLSATILRVVETLQTQTEQANLEIKITKPNEPIFITGDETELFEVFENLIDNAIKYGEKGKKIEINLDKAEPNSGFDYSVNIIDFGEGVASQHLPRLTERFYRVDADVSRKKKGTGLGLAIVKHILNRHEGMLNIISKIGKGTKVEVFLKK